MKPFEGFRTQHDIDGYGHNDVEYQPIEKILLYKDEKLLAKISSTFVVEHEDKYGKILYRNNIPYKFESSSRLSTGVIVNWSSTKHYKGDSKWFNTVAESDEFKDKLIDFITDIGSVDKVRYETPNSMREIDYKEDIYADDDIPF